ncbi:WYL domain-containing protein [Adhaeribacter sp. BT258]|uniref:WYL domain-containing protein n=1 Tax=Adhaeribacter terrigena TaxID=2793070 RepID=A0ABS1C3E4_9BACT|nr:WYL domain-containing protein [Adhaeribacter terrigena]MBK0403070.1 WYL domain-containing protein [Adhaeribacter terrigena]
MPVNKDLLSRIRIIDACLRNRSRIYWSKEALIQKILEKSDIKIKKRTIDNDIYLMRNSEQLNYNAPIAFSKLHGGYYYTDPDFTLEKLPLNSEDLNALKLVATTLRQYKEIAMFKEFSANVEKVINLVEFVPSLSSSDFNAFIDFEKAPFSKGGEYLNSISNAISSKTVLLVSYQKFQDQQSSLRTISPYLLKEYRNRWYLVGLQHDKAEVRTFALDRIISLVLKDNEKYNDQESIDSDTYFRNTIGISLTDGIVEEVILSFKPSSGYYIKTQYLHSTQEILVDNDRELRIKLNVVSNYELISTILSFGNKVKVICPKELQKEIANKLRQAQLQYE